MYIKNQHLMTAHNILQVTMNENEKGLNVGLPGLTEESPSQYRCAEIRQINTAIIKLEVNDAILK